MKILKKGIFSPAALFSLLEISEKKYHIGTKVLMRVANIRGVPGKHVDVLIDPRVVDDCGTKHALLEWSERNGCYDGQHRYRFCVRYIPTAQYKRFPALTVCVQENETETLLSIHERIVDDVLTDGTVLPFEENTVLETVGLPVLSFPRLRFTADAHNMTRIIGYHLSHFYLFLMQEPGVQGVVDAWAASAPVDKSISWLNRSASRELYRFARECGWRKLTLREQRHLGLSGQWHRISDCDAAYAGRIKSEQDTGPAEMPLQALQNTAIADALIAAYK